MSLKDLFNSNKTVHSSSLSDSSKEVESHSFVEVKRKLRNEFEPPINYETASNFARYGSAERYYVDSIKHICNQYPYDGSHAERLAWEFSASYLDKWLYKNRYPKSTGYVTLGISGKAAGAQQNFYGAPSNKEYIYFVGGPNAPTASVPTLKKLYETGNIYDAEKMRESNLDFKLSRGLTTEFWLKKEAFDSTSTEHEVIFDLWNQKASGSNDYGRFRVELCATGSECFRISARSGSSGFQDVSFGTDNPTPAEVADGTWKHYSISLKNDGSDVSAKLYIDGTLTETKTISGAALGPVTGALDATIGALRTTPAGDAYHSDSGLGSGKLSASLDDFRYWKTERDAKQIGRNWFTNVYGGTNTDDANVDLGVYFKFNEGVFDIAAKDKTVLDYSGRISNGTWNNYTASVGMRSTGSAMTESGKSERENQDPIIYGSHPKVAALIKELKASGSAWDMKNNSAIVNTLPAWTTENMREPNNELLNLLQIVGSYLDKLHTQIEVLPKIKDLYGQAYEHNLASASVEPVFFSDRLLTAQGFPAPDLFQEATMMQDLASRDEGYEYEFELNKIKNRIYQNVYSSLNKLMKSKGTEKGFRNLIRCFGVDDELIKLNLYVDNSTYTLRDSSRYSAVKRKFATFRKPAAWHTVVYQVSSSTETNSRSFISGSKDSLEEHIPFTMEAEVIFPQKPPKGTIDWFATSFVTASMFGMVSPDTPSDPDNTSTTTTDLFWVSAERGGFESESARFVLSSSMLPDGVSLSSSATPTEDVYDNTKWNFAVRLRPAKWPWPDYISGSTVKDTYPLGEPGASGHTANEDYILDFYGVQYVQDQQQNMFHVSASVTHAKGKSFMTDDKRAYVGAKKENLLYNLQYNSDVKVSNVAVWYNYVDNDTINVHAQDARNMGLKNPLEPVYIFDNSGLQSGSIPAIETLLLHWDFATVTGSGPESTPGGNDASYIVMDVSSGSAANVNRYNSTFGDISERHYMGKATPLRPNTSTVIDIEYIPTALQELPENQSLSNMVELRTRDDEFFTLDARPQDYYFAFEKSMYATISEEMITMFATIVDFNNLWGMPINRYRLEYKDLSKLRQMFFERMGNTPDLDKYLEYYKWFDNALGEMLLAMVPASMKTTDGIVSTIESHILERNKYWTKYPSMEMKGSDPENGAVSINRHLYSWKEGHHPVGGSEQDNCVFWSDRAVPDQSGSPISSSVSASNYTRKAIYDAKISALNRSYTTPVRFAAKHRTTLAGGINFDPNKNVNYVFNAAASAGPTPLDFGLPGGMPLRYLLARQQTFESGSAGYGTTACDDAQHPLAKVKVVHDVVDGMRGFESRNDNADDNIYADLIMPFNLIEDDVTTGYTDLINGATKVASNVNIVNVHHDSYGPDGDTPIQGPFTSRHVGGRKFRHNKLSFQGAQEREEGWLMLIGTSTTNPGTYALVGMDYPHPHGPYPRIDRPRHGSRFRDETAKRPVNFKNIKTTSDTAGNYYSPHEFLQIAGRSLNNLHFRAVVGELDITTTGSLGASTQGRSLLSSRGASTARLHSAPSDPVQPAVLENFTLPTRQTSSHVFASKFSSHGSPEQVSRGFLDIHAEEYSPYNAMPFRDLGIRGSGSTSVRIAATDIDGVTGSVTSNTHANVPEGLQTLRQRHAGQYGADSQYDGHQSWHKVNPNPITSPVEGGTPTNKYDNDYVTHHIPRNDNQYAWIKSSLEATSSIGVNSTVEFQKRGYGHHISWFTHASGSTVKFGKQVHPTFISSSQAGSVAVSAYSFARVFKLNSTDYTNFLPQPTNMNLNIVDSMTSATNTIGHPFTVPLADSGTFSAGGDEDVKQYVNSSGSALIDTIGFGPGTYGAPHGRAGNPQAFAFNNLMFLRGNQYGYNAWNQLRVSDNLVTRHQRKNNILSLTVDRPLPTTMGYPVVQIENYTVSAVDFTTQPGLVAIKRPDGEIRYIKYSHFDAGFGVDRVDEITNYVSSSNSWNAISDYLDGASSELVGVIHKQTIFPAARNQTKPAIRKRERFIPSFWAPNRDNLSASIDNYNLRADGRRVNKTGMIRDIDDSTVRNFNILQNVLPEFSSSMWPLEARRNIFTSDPFHGGSDIELNYAGSRIWSIAANAPALPILAGGAQILGDGAGSFMTNYGMFHMNMPSPGTSQYVHKQVSQLSVAASYGRPHTIVSRDSVHNPSAPLSIKARKFIYHEKRFSVSHTQNGYENYKSFGTSSDDGLTKVDIPTDYFGRTYEESNWYYTDQKFGSDPLRQNAIFELTRSIGHITEGLNSNNAVWEVPQMAGRGPFYSDYEEYYQDLSGKTKDKAVLPEYRISDRMEFINNVLGGDITKKDKEWLSIVGSLTSSGNNVLDSNGRLDNDQSTSNEEFYLTYAYSDLAKNFKTVTDQAAPANMLKPFRLTLTADALMKFLPYDGFYPASRCEQMVEQFGKSYSKYVSLNSEYDNVNKGFDVNRVPNPNDVPGNFPNGTAAGGKPTDVKNSKAGYRPFIAPLFAPGILFNTIKSGIAVDYPVLTNGMVPTASYDRDGGINWQIANEYFDERIPFEALVEPETFMANKTFVDMEPHPDAHLNVTASWNGAGDNLYKLMMHNFLAEIPNMFLENGLSSIQSGRASKITPEIFTDGLGNQHYKEYRALLRVYKSQTGYDPTVQQMPPSASNHAANHKAQSYAKYSNYLNEYAWSSYKNRGSSGAGNARFSGKDVLYTNGSYHPHGHATDGSSGGHVMILKLGAEPWSGSAGAFGGESRLSEGFNPASSTKAPLLYEANSDISGWDNPGGNKAGHDKNFPALALKALKYHENPFAWSQLSTADMSPRYFITASVGASHPLCGGYLPVYETDRLRFRSSWNLENTPLTVEDTHIASSSIAFYSASLQSPTKNSAKSFRSQMLNKPLQSIVGVDYQAAEYSYPRPQRPHAVDTFMMYSMPSAFGPPCAGGYAISPAGFLTHRPTDSPWHPTFGHTIANSLRNSNIQAQIGGFEGEHASVTGSSVGSSLNSTTYGMYDSTNGYNAPFTPPYYDGQAWAFLTWKPQTSGPFTIEEIANQTSIEYLRYEWNYVSGAYGDLGTFGPQGFAMNDNAMHVNSSVNVKQIIDLPGTTVDSKGDVIEITDTGAEPAKVWSIQTKFETPMLNFISASMSASISGSSKSQYTTSYNPPNRVPAYSAMASGSVGFGVHGLVQNKNSNNNYFFPWIPEQTKSSVWGSHQNANERFHFASASFELKTSPFDNGFPGICTPAGMWHQYGVYNDSPDVGVFMQLTDIPESYIQHGTELPIANPMFMTITGSPDQNAGAYDKYWDGGYYLPVDAAMIGHCYSDVNHGAAIPWGYVSGAAQFPVQKSHAVTTPAAPSASSMNHTGLSSPLDNGVKTYQMRERPIYFFHRAPGGSYKEAYKWLQTWNTQSNAHPDYGFEHDGGAKYVSKISHFYESSSAGTWDIRLNNAVPYDLTNGETVTYAPPNEGNHNTHHPHQPYAPYETEFLEGVSYLSGAQNPRTGYRHSGSLSASLLSRPVEGQQITRWRLVANGPQAGLVADRIHMQIVAADYGTVLDSTYSPFIRYGAVTTGSIPFNNSQAAAPFSDDLTRGFPGPQLGHWFQISNFYTEQAPVIMAQQTVRTESVLENGNDEYQGGLKSTNGVISRQYSFDTVGKKQGGAGYQSPVLKDKKGMIPTPPPICSSSNSPSAVTINETKYYHGRFYPNQGGRRPHMVEVNELFIGGPRPVAPCPNMHGTNGDSHDIKMRARPLEPAGSGDFAGTNPFESPVGMAYSGSTPPRLPSGEMLTELGGWNDVTGGLGSFEYISGWKSAASMVLKFNNAMGSTYHARASKPYVPAKLAVTNGGRLYPSEFFNINKYNLDPQAWPDQQASSLADDGRASVTRDDLVDYYRKKVVDIPKPVTYPNNMPDMVDKVFTGGQRYPAFANGNDSNNYYIDLHRFAPKALHNENNILQRWYTTQAHIRNVRQADENLQLTQAGNLQNPGPHRSITLYDTPAGVNVLSTRRTILSGEFQPKGGNTAQTGSLADLLKFNKDPVKLGVPARTAKLSEAIVVVPFRTATDGTKEFFLFDQIYNHSIDAGVYRIYKDQPDMIRSDALKDQFEKMDEFVIPPALDFTRNPEAAPAVMYIFPFEYKLNRDDVTDIWQGVMPKTAIQVKEESRSICHTLDLASIQNGGSSPINTTMRIHDEDGADDLASFKDLQFMVFKVKKRAEINYFKQTDSTVDDGLYSKTFKVGTSEVGESSTTTDLQYSYNWPYDFCSLVEAAKIDMTVELWKGEYDYPRDATGERQPGDRRWSGDSSDDGGE